MYLANFYNAIIQCVNTIIAIMDDNSFNQSWRGLPTPFLGQLTRFEVGALTLGSHNFRIDGLSIRHIHTTLMAGGAVFL